MDKAHAYVEKMCIRDRLMAVLDTCTEAQRRRFLLYALDGLKIGRASCRERV